MDTLELTVSSEDREFVNRPPLKRQVTRHRTAVATLAVRPDGYTLTDGCTSHSVDGEDFGMELSRDVRAMRVEKLYFVDNVSLDLWTRKVPAFPDTLRYGVMAAAGTSECPTCDRTECHRYLATERGIARFAHCVGSISIEHVKD